MEERISCLGRVVFEVYQRGSPIYTSNEEPEQSSDGEKLVERAAVDRGDLEGTQHTARPMHVPTKARATLFARSQSQIIKRYDFC